MSDTTRFYYISNHGRNLKVTVCPQLGCSFTAPQCKEHYLNRKETANILRFARLQMASIKKVSVLR